MKSESKEGGITMARTLPIQKTTLLKKEEVQRDWYVVDAEGQALGRLATRIALVLMGKNKPNWTPHVDCGNFVVVVNADKIKLTGKKTPEIGWKSLFSSKDIVGIKINSLGGKKIATFPELAFAVAKKLVNIGIAPDHIIIWDRLTEEMRQAGYPINRNRKDIQCFGTDRDYETQIEIAGSVGSCFSRIISRMCTALINIPVIKDHDLAGVSLSLKNFYGAIHNPNKYHFNNCDPFIADLNTHPYIRKKLRLIICDGLRVQYNGGPAYNAQWIEKEGCLIFGRDPVATDKVAELMIEEKRKLHGLPSLKVAGRPAKHIHTAAVKGLGIDNIKRIKIINA